MSDIYRNYNFTQDGKEIIARKKNSIKSLYIAGAVALPILGVGSLALFVFVLATGVGNILSIFSLLSLIAVCFGSLFFVCTMINKLNKTPDILITYKDGLLYFENGTCSPAGITNIQHKETRSVKGTFSKFKIYTDTGIFELNFVDDYERVLQRLHVLNTEAYQKAIMEAKKNQNSQIVSESVNEENSETKAQEEELKTDKSQTAFSGENDG